MTAAPLIAVDDLLASIDTAGARAERPKYLRLVDAFADCVVSGRFRPGQRVPTEAKLAEELPVSIGTVQKAMAKLASDGVVVRHRKTGTFIADRRSQANEVFVYRFQDPDTGESMLPFVRTLSVTEDTSPGPWADALSSARTVRVDRLVWFDRQPPAFSSVFFKPKHGREFLDLPLDELHGLSLHRRLIERFNLPSVRMHHNLSCRALSDRAAEALALAPGSLGTVWEIVDFTHGNVPFVFQRYQLPPGHRPVEIEEAIGH